MRNWIFIVSPPIRLDWWPRERKIAENLSRAQTVTNSSLDVKIRLGIIITFSALSFPVYCR